MVATTTIFAMKEISTKSSVDKISEAGFIFLKGVLRSDEKENRGTLLSP